jgi:hypothetical protein
VSMAALSRHSHASTRSPCSRIGSNPLQRAPSSFLHRGTARGGNLVCSPLNAGRRHLIGLTQVMALRREFAHAAATFIS